MARLDRGLVLSFAGGDKVPMKCFKERMKLRPSLFADQQSSVSRRAQQVAHAKAIVGRKSRQCAQRPWLERGPPSIRGCASTYPGRRLELAGWKELLQKASLFWRRCRPLQPAASMSKQKPVQTFYNCSLSITMCFHALPETVK